MKVKNAKENIDMGNMDEFNREKWKMPRWVKYTTSLIAVVFMAFVLGWLFLIPVTVVVLLAYGLVVYARDRKNRITVKSTEAMKRREEEIKREKERITYEESGTATKLSEKRKV